MPQPRRGGKTLVRGADGALYMLTKTDVPVKLTENEERKVTKVLKEAEEKLGNILNEEIPRLDLGCHATFHITIPDVLME